MRLHKSLGAALVAILAVTFFETASSYSRIETRARSAETSNYSLDSVGDPLFLTPLLEAGQADSARSSAKVTHPELLGVESYAGFFTVNKTFNSNLFFWYFPAKENSTGAPVVLFLEGGPGTSLFFSLFAQNGPFSVAPKSGSLELRQESWNNKHNLIYMDSPVGTGYSFTEFSEGLASSQTQIGDELRIALQQFFQLFPAIRKNDFFVTGTSYAGKFVPAVSYSIHTHNARANDDQKINLKGIAIGNGYTDPINQLAYGQYLHSIGLVDQNGRDEFLAEETILRDAILRGLHSAAYDLALRLVIRPYDTLLTKLTGYSFAFNILQTDFGRDPLELFNFVQRPDARLALHVGDISFEPTSDLVKSRLKRDMTQSHAHLVAFLLDHYPVLIYTGNLDIACNYPGVQKYIENLAWSGAQRFKSAQRHQWRVADRQLAGYIKKFANLTEVLVRNAGHMSSRDQPKWILELIEKFTGVSSLK